MIDAVGEPKPGVAAEREKQFLEDVLTTPRK